MATMSEARDRLLIELSCAVQQIAQPAGAVGVSRALSEYLALASSANATRMLGEHGPEVQRAAEAIQMEVLGMQTAPPLEQSLRIWIARSVLRSLRDNSEAAKVAGANVLNKGLIKQLPNNGEWSTRGLAGEVFDAMIAEMLR